MQKGSLVQGATNLVAQFLKIVHVPKILTQHLQEPIQAFSVQFVS